MDIKILNNIGKKVTDPQKIVKLFNERYVNVGPNSEKKLPKSLKKFHQYLSKVKVAKTFFLKPVIPQEIFDIILSYNARKTLGPNSIPIYILKISNNFFSDLLSDIVNLSFKTGIFPDLCKLSKIIPIFKRDDPMLCVNYRPISLLSIFSKIFEKLIYNRMYSFLNSNNLIYGKQFGFRAKHSVNHALISTTELIKSQLEDGNYVAGIFIDLEKAFDTVNHVILIQKLSYYGFRGNSQNLIKSFLSNRKQYVAINGFESDKVNVTCGVPQGSTLGPLLFLIYINDLRFSLKFATANHFADDTCIIYQSKKLKALESDLNHDLKLCGEWLNANRLSLNVDKTKLLLFHSNKKKMDYDIRMKINCSQINPSDHVKYLGIFLDKNLAWDYHISQLSNKFSRSNDVMFKLRKFIPKQTLLSVYHSIFYSHLTYEGQVWSLTTQHNIDTINILKKNA